MTRSRTICFINVRAGFCEPQGLKPTFLLASYGTAEAVPFHEAVGEIGNRYMTTQNRF